MSTARRIVYVTPVLPWPPDQGARHFQLEAARALATVGPVAWITRRLAGQDAAEATLRAEGFDLQLDRSFASRSPWARLRRRVRIDAAARWKREPREIHFVSSPGVKARVRAMAATHPDAWFVGAYWSTVRALSEAPAGRRILLAADVESMAARAGARFSSGGDAVARRLFAAERDAFRSVDHLLCLTAEDEVAAAELLDDGGRSPRIGRWPVGLSVPEPCAWPPPTPSGPRLLAYGHWEAEFNRDGLDWFVREIWPAIRTRHPEATVRIVGRGVESVRRTVAGVEWIGYVEDLRSELEACHVVAIPLRYAGGIRYRLIEALGYGRPVVCTSVAAAGADAREGETHLQADDPASWAEAVERALEPEPARRLRDAGARVGPQASRSRREPEGSPRPLRGPRGADHLVTADRGTLVRALGALTFALLPLDAVGSLPVDAGTRALIGWALVAFATTCAWWRVPNAMVAAVATWCGVLALNGALGVGIGVGAALVQAALVAAALWAPRPTRHRATIPWTAVALAAVFSVGVTFLPPQPRLDGDGPAHLGAVHDALDADRWSPPDHSFDARGTDPGRDPRFGVLHGTYAAMTRWTRADPRDVFTRAPALLVPLGLLGFAAWMRAWTTPPVLAAGLAAWMVLAGAGGRGFALWRSAFPGDAAVLLAGFAIASISLWIRDPQRTRLPWAAVTLLAASVAIHPFAWWIVVACLGLGLLIVAGARRHHALLLPWLTVTAVTGVAGLAVLAPRLLERGSTGGIHGVATDVILFGDGWLFVDPLSLAHWGGITALCIAPLTLLAPRSWWSRPWAPLAAGTAFAGWVLALNPLVATPAWGAVSYLLLRTLRLVITPWWWWSFWSHARGAWGSSGRRSRLRLALLVVATATLAWIDLQIAADVVRRGPPRPEPGVPARVDAMHAALDRVGPGIVVADPRTSYALRARRGGSWPVVPAAHSSPRDVGLTGRLAAFRRLHGATVDSVSWFASLDRLDATWILVHRDPRAFGRFDEYGWIPDADAARRLERRLATLSGTPVDSGATWSLWRRPGPADWNADAATIGPVPTRVDEGVAPLVRGSRFEIVAVSLDTTGVHAGAWIGVELALRAREGEERTLHPDWEEVALRWSGPSPDVPGFARSFDKLYRKIALERSARSAARFATGRVPFQGTWPPRAWPEGSLVIDRYELRIPPHVRPGLYEVELSIQEKPWRPRRRLHDVLRDDDRYTGPVVATVEVLPAASR